jgi:pSer/pThr/pTyr-binding forkhead associated (FHA) protein
MMESLRIRFEQKRGHFMIIQSEPPLSRESINDIQLQMLRSCEIPGFLPLETEELNGVVSLRYGLSGFRMLSESMRTSKWSMADMMAALCRVAEVLEECRLYLLDSERIKLEDEFIFIGSDCQDLRFAYIPLSRPVLDKKDDLERLVIRWMMKVTDPAGEVMQNVFRLVTSKDFVPASLRTYTRQYLAASPNVKPSMTSVSPQYDNAGYLKRPIHSTAGAINTEYGEQSQSSGGLSAKANSWGIFQSSSADLQSASQLLGDDSEPWLKGGGSESEDDAEPAESRMEIGRWRTVAGCTAMLLIALVWRYFYASQPGQQRLLFCMFITLAAGAGFIYLWNGLPLREKKRRIIGNIQGNLPNRSESRRESSADYDDERKGIPRFAVNVSPYPSQTTWLQQPEELTGLLNADDTRNAAVYYLVCENGGNGSRIDLGGDSLVIGRSTEAAQHVDTASGISRAHLEILKISDHWKVKDLGSRNGSSLNGEPMAPYELYPLQPGDFIVLANSKYRFVQDA